MAEINNCGNCARSACFADELGCNNEESEAYGLEVQSDDCCDEWKEREDEE